MPLKVFSTRSGRGVRSNRDLSKESKALKSIRRREKIHSFIMSPLYFCVLVVFTLYSLYADDFRLATTGAASDNVWNAFTLLTILFFLFDIVINGYYKPNCWKTTAFYIEILALLSLILDLSWIFNCPSVTDWTPGLPLMTALADAKRCSQTQLNAFW